MTLEVLAASVFILGGGATGLFMAVELAEAGISVVLAEKRSRLASGPSTTNEGMLHRGTYHAAAVNDRKHAIEIANRCAHGYERLLETAPEAVEEPLSRSFVLLSGSTDVEDVRSRWDESGVPYSPVSIREYRRLEPGVNCSSVSAIFEVEDKSVNARVIYRNLVRRAERLGVKIFTSVEVDRVDPEHNLVYLKELNGQNIPAVSAQAYVCTAGTGIKSFFAEKLGTDVPMRFWKSHLVDTPRLSRHNMFCIAPGEITLMHHGAWSIAGLNADAVPVTEPSDEVAPQTESYVYDRMRAFVPSFDPHGSVVRACTKVDVGRAVDIGTGGNNLTLSFAFGEPVSGHFWVIPGKMTEVPCVAETLVAVLRERVPARTRLYDPDHKIRTAAPPEIASRPIDDYGPPRFAHRCAS
jgi:glycine/D-amino acid oxidase-like deaminating enzyme